MPCTSRGPSYGAHAGVCVDYWVSFNVLNGSVRMGLYDTSGCQLGCRPLFWLAVVGTMNVVEVVMLVRTKDIDGLRWPHIASQCEE